MAVGGIPVVIVPNGSPVSPGALGIPVTIVGGNGAAAVQDGQTVAMEDGSGNSLGNGTIHIDANGNVTVDWPGGGSGTPLEDGEPVNLDSHDGNTILASTVARVADGNLVGVLLPQNYAVIQDGVGNFDIANYGSGQGAVAVIARVSNNEPGVQLANSTTKIAINAAPVSITAGGKTVGATIAVDQGEWQAFPLTDATDAIVESSDTIPVIDMGGSNEDAVVVVDNHVVLHALLAPNRCIAHDQQALQIPVTGTYTDTATLTVANGVITGITLS